MEWTIRTMSLSEFRMVVGWADQEGWNSGLHDASVYYNTDPDGFFIGLLDNKPVGAISAVRYGDSYGFLGFYIVREGFRGQGYGLALWNRAMEHLGDRIIGLDGVPDQQANYKKSGFVLDHENYRYEGKAVTSHKRIREIVPLSDIPFDTLLSYDREFVPAPRETFLRGWVDLPESLTLGWMEREQLLGYGTIRRCGLGWKVGPLFADTESIATDLFHALISEPFAGDPVFLDVPGTNKQAVKLAEKHDMVVSFNTARMYRGDCPELPHKRWYGVTSFELG